MPAEQQDDRPPRGAGLAPPAAPEILSTCPESKNGVSNAASDCPAGGVCQAAAAVAPPTPGHSAVGTSATQEGVDAAGQCPFLAGVGGVQLQGAAAPVHSAKAAAAAAAPAGITPAGAAGEAAQEGAGAPAVCPLGFGSGRQPKLGEYHCLICRSLYHDCVATACGHRYCAGCVRGARDCPTCGADVGELRPDAHTQALVDRYIDAHAGNHTIWELEGSGGQEVDGMAGERSRAAFLLQLGLRAIAAGNIDSARHRFGQCRDDLQQQLAAARQQGAPPDALASLQCRLGAVSGCLGDCCRAEGDAAGTLGHYRASVELLRAAGGDPEAQQALSVALNKVGELHHLQGDVAGAAEQYAQALALRRGLLAATQQQWLQREKQAECGGASSGSGSRDATDETSAAQGAEAETAESAAGAAAAVEAAMLAAQGDEACCSAALDLAASCLKLSGARQGLGQAGEAEALLAEATALLEGLQQSGALGRQPERLQRKCASLVQFVGMLLQQRQAQA